MDPIPAELTCAHSPDSDDAFMFYGLATRKVRSPLVNFRHVLNDIETLNRQAMEGVHALTAVSYHAYPYIADKYALMASGSSVGDGYGPLVVARKSMGPDELKGKRVAVPGNLTTAYLALRLFEPSVETIVIPFDRIVNAVEERHVDAGLVIHEAQLTYGQTGLFRVLDLGRWWKDKSGLPLPLGANALLRSLDKRVASECNRLMRETIRYALDHRQEALSYALQFARDMDPSLADKFVGMYVNHHTEDCGTEIPAAAQKLLDMGYEAGLIPRRVEVEFVR